VPVSGPPASVAGKVIAITGVSSGIGRACARSLARQGALVVGIGRRADRGAAIASGQLHAASRFG
jgi:NADP-dependent 3-hydroxy acid dehydrogenase YdfG